MLGAVAGLASQGGVQVDEMEAAGVSYPGFEGDAGAARLRRPLASLEGSASEPRWNDLFVGVPPANVRTTTVCLFVAWSSTVIVPASEPVRVAR